MSNGSPEHVIIFVTTSSKDEAQRIGMVLLQERQAACVSIVPETDSHYWWQGKRESAKETLLMVKTRTSQINRVVNLVRQNHSYAVPEIVAVPIIGGNPDYLDWIDRELVDSSGGKIRDVE